MASAPRRRWLLACLLAYLALGGALGVTLWMRARAPIFLDQPPRPEGSPDRLAAQGPAPVIEVALDPNTAPWHDLARLPRIGETLARAIVAYREARLAEWCSARSGADAGQAPPVFARVEDLLPIKGVGPKTLEQIRPHLRFPGLTTRAAPP